MNDRLLVDVVTDVVCPWCYVGLRSIESAAQDLARDFEVSLRFRPYQLGPEAPAKGVDREAYYRMRFPDEGQRAAAQSRLGEAARSAGFNFDPSIPTRLPNTLTAHQALRLAASDGAAASFARALYDAYWLDDAAIGESETLGRIAAAIGLDGETFRARLDRGEKRAETAADAAGLRDAGVAGVPTFIVNERRGFSGALPPQQLKAAIEEAARRSREMAS